MATSDETLAEFTRGVIEAVQEMIDRVLTLSNDVAGRVAETVHNAIPEDLISNARRKLSDQFPGGSPSEKVHAPPAPMPRAAAPAKKAPAKKAPAKKAPAKKAPAKKAPAKKAPAKKAPAKKAPAKKAPAKAAPATQHQPAT